MLQPATDTTIFYLKRASYVRIRLLGWLLIAGSACCALLCIVLGARLLPTYEHTFTLYLKWQDALVASLWYIALIALGGCVLVVRFLYALRSGYRKGMLILKQETFIGRDLSPKNLASIYWAVHATVS